MRGQSSEFAVAYLEALERARLLCEGAKASDYNSGDVEITDYSLWDHEKHWWNLVWHKTLRLRSLLFSGNPPKCETLEDTAIDLINYAAFIYAELKITQEKR